MREGRKYEAVKFTFGPEVTDKLNNGYEMREVEVLVLYDTPRTGMKRIVRIDNNEHLREEAMTLEEMQRGFGFGEQS